MIFWTLKSNSFAASTIRVEASQRVISTGPYRIVRHPMYLGVDVWLLSTPVALGSYFALPVLALLIPLIVVRLLNEQKVFVKDCPDIPTIASTLAFVWCLISGKRHFL